MKNLNSFNEFVNERYDEKQHKVLNTMRSINDKSFTKGLSKFLSVVHDIYNFDFKSAIHSFKNKSGFEKLRKITNELATLKYLKKKDDRITYSDLRQYGFDPDIIDYLNDPDVIEYMQVDKKMVNHFNEIKELIDFLKGYKEWFDNLLKP